MTNTRRITAPRMGALDRIPTPLPARLAHVRQRRHVRCQVPTEHPVFVSVSQRTRVQRACRTVALDVSVGGMALQVIEPYALGMPNEGEDVVLALDLDGAQVEIGAHILSASAKKLRLRFTVAANGAIDPRLLLVLADVTTLDMRAIDRARVQGLLNHRLGYGHFAGLEHLDVRVFERTSSGVAPWWQIRFLDYIVNWTEADGLTCAAADRHEDLAEPLHKPDLEIMRAVALRVAARGATKLPEHRSSFDFITQTLRPGRAVAADPALPVAADSVPPVAP